MVLETERLILRNFEESDSMAMYALNRDSEVLKFTGDVPFSNPDEALLFIRNYDHYATFGFGRWAVLLKNSNAFIGWCGLKQHEEGFVDIGFRFFKTEWGKGFATEAAQSVLDFGRNRLKLPVIIGRVASENTASIRVLEKIGLRFYKTDLCEGIQGARYYK